MNRVMIYRLSLSSPRTDSIIRIMVACLACTPGTTGVGNPSEPVARGADRS